MRRTALLVILTAGLLAGQSVAPTKNPRAQWTQPRETFKSRVVTSGLESPWEITWGPDGFLWVTERVGKRVVRVNPADGSKSIALTLGEIYQTLSQDGLLGMALHPDLLRRAGRDYVYLAYTYNAGAAGKVDRRMKIRRYTYDAATQQLGDPMDILTRLPHGTDHGAGRLVFGPDAKLYLSRGDHGSNFLANYCDVNRAQETPTEEEIRQQDWTTYQGKILRINLDGSIPRDNPVIRGVRSHIYSYGHRNPEGMAFDGDKLYASEHGESIDDELNLIQPGKNYGWPLIAGFQDDQSYVFANWSASRPEPCASLKFDVLNPPPSVPRLKESESKIPDFVPPLKTFFTVPNNYDLRTLGNATTAPAGVDVYTNSRIPGWNHSLLMTGMISGVVFRMPLANGGTRIAGEPITYFKARNRYRDLAINPDGVHIYVATDSEGRVVDDSGALTRELQNPGAILEFTYTGTDKK
jgi:PQQ-dependent dehydrogenase (s-GDH family)